MSTESVNTPKVKKRIIRLSLIGLFLSLGYIFISILFWFFIYINNTRDWIDARYYAIWLFLLAALLIAAGMALSIAGLILAARRGNKKSIICSIAGILIICLIFIANIAVWVYVDHKTLYRAFTEYAETN